MASLVVPSSPTSANAGRMAGSGGRNAGVARGAAAGPGYREFVLLVALMTSLVALSIDAMLPALATIGAELGARHANDAQLVLSALFLGLAVAQMIYGPLSDSVGRKPAIYLGFGLFIMGCLLSALATSFRGDAGRALPAGDRRRGPADRDHRDRARSLRGSRDGADHVVGDGGLHPGAGAGAGHRPSDPDGRELARDLRRVPRGRRDRRDLVRRPGSRRRCRWRAGRHFRRAGS